MDELVEFSWGSMLWHAGARGRPASTLSVATMTLLPGQQNERHHHASCEEVMLVLRGEVEHSIGEETSTRGPGQWVLIPAGVPHHSRNLGDNDVVLFITYGSPERDYQSDLAVRE